MYTTLRTILFFLDKIPNWVYGRTFLIGLFVALKIGYLLGKATKNMKKSRVFCA